MRRAALVVVDGLVPLVLLATVLGVLVPVRALADRSDAILACLVLLTALGIAPHQLAALRGRWRALVVLSAGPFVVLGLAGWGLSRAFAGPVRDGVLALGLSSTEVAMVGLVALAGADAALALGALAGSLVVSALAGPLVAASLGGASAQASAGGLLGRFALVVLVPLVVGVGLRAVCPRLGRAEAELSAASTLTVSLLVYAALSGATAGLDSALVAAASFLGLCLVVAAGWWRLAPPATRIAGAFAAGGRDFAVAAALAAQAFGPAAGAVGGLYGVLVLLAGAGAASIRRRRNSAHGAAHAETSTPGS